MTNIAFIGLGNMGGPMAVNLVKAGHSVTGFDIVSANLANLEAAGGKAAPTIAGALRDAEVIITMLPAGAHVRSVYLDQNGILQHARPGSLLIDCSTIDVESARHVAGKAAAQDLEMIDAPVSGGVVGAGAATLTFMAGGPRPAFERARPVFECMGKNIFHAGDAGNGQAAKICNNMILGISMIGVAEAFVLAEKLGLDHQKLFDISSTASGQCWSLTSYCPVPGPLPSSPANNGYKPGFSADMMLKDLRLAQEAAQVSEAKTPLGAEAAALYGLFSEQGNGGVDFSGIIRMLRGS